MLWDHRSVSTSRPTRMCILPSKSTHQRREPSTHLHAPQKKHLLDYYDICKDVLIYRVYAMHMFFQDFIFRWCLLTGGFRGHLSTYFLLLFPAVYWEKSLRTMLTGRSKRQMFGRLLYKESIGILSFVAGLQNNGSTHKMVQACSQVFLWEWHLLKALKCTSIFY